jgi:anti-sigma28 factor (negative regulator of flagellin synthesis)
MNVNGVGNSSPVQKIVNSPIYREVPQAGATSQGDRVELSGVSHLKSILQRNDIRVDKVASIKAAIEAGTYETPDKMDVAVDRLLEDING